MSAAGCVQIFEDRISGAEFSRAGLDQALAALEGGGVLVVWRLDRLGRSMLDTVKIVLDLDPLRRPNLTHDNVLYHA